MSWSLEQIQYCRNHVKYFKDYSWIYRYTSERYDLYDRLLGFGATAFTIATGASAFTTEFTSVCEKASLYGTIMSGIAATLTTAKNHVLKYNEIATKCLTISTEYELLSIKLDTVLLLPSHQREDFFHFWKQIQEIRQSLIQSKMTIPDFAKNAYFSQYGKKWDDYAKDNDENPKILEE